MKTIVSTFLFVVILSTASAQFKSAGVLIGGGYTAINVEKALEPTVLSDWNNFSLVFKALGEYQINENIILGAELGGNRLYYWEYPVPGVSYYRWRTEWTTNLVVYFMKYFNGNLFVQAGAGIHGFHNGTVVGLLIGGGYSIMVADRFSIPLGLRIEPIFGTGTPIAINLGSGVRYHFH